jgi:hypothetical protein
MSFRSAMKGAGAPAATTPAPAKNAPAPTPAAAPAKPAAGPRGAPPVRATPGRYSGLRPAEERSPFLESGTHRVRFIATKEVRVKSKKPWLKTELEVLESDTVKPGAHRTIRKVITDEAFEMSGPEILSMMMAALGYESTEMAEFEAQHPNWSEMLDAVHGVPEACAEHGENPLADMTAVVTGFDAEKDGRNFVNYSWAPDPDRTP